MIIDRPTSSFLSPYYILKINSVVSIASTALINNWLENIKDCFSILVLILMNELFSQVIVTGFLRKLIRSL